MPPVDNSLDNTPGTVTTEPVFGANSNYEMNGTNPVAPKPQPPSTPKFLPSLRLNRMAALITSTVFVVIFVLGVGTLFLTGHSSPTKSLSSQANNYAVSNIATNNLSSTDEALQLGNVSELQVNGQLQVTKNIVITPAATEPSSPVAGEIYYNQATNSPYYYNGTTFESLAPTKGVTALGGSSGNIAVGNGLQVTNGQLSISSQIAQDLSAANTGPTVTSLQGKSGAITLDAGSGIDINGTTISSNVGSVVNTFQGQSGNVTLTAGSGIAINGTTISFSGGSVVNSLQGQSGAVTLTAGPGITINGTTIGLTSAGGGVGPLNNLSGAVTIDGSANEITVNTNSIDGDITLSTPQAIAVSSSPTFASLTLGSLNVAGVVHTNALGQLSTGPVMLGTDTSGDYVAGLGAANGLTVIGGSGAGSTPSLSINYGNAADTSVEGNTVLTCASGTGNLTGGGNAFALGSGGACNDITITDSPDFTGNLTVEGSGGVSIGSSTNQGVVSFTDGTSDGYTASLGLEGSTLSSSQTYTLPTTGGTICLSTGNCNGAGGVSTLNGLNGALILEDTTGELTFNPSGTNIDISLPQDLAASSTPTFANLTLNNLNSAGVVHTNALGQLSTGPVLLDTETSGNYVNSLGTVTGLTLSGNSGSNATPSISVNYGDSGNTSVEGNTSFTCASGTGNLNGGGNVITLGDGGTCNDINITSSPTFSGNLTVQGGQGLSVGTATTAGVITLSDGFGDTTTLQTADSNGTNLTFVLPGNSGNSGQCLETDGFGNLSFADCANVSGSVSSIDGLSGTVGLEDTEGQLTFSNDLQDININLPQELTSSSSPTFDGLTLSTTPLGIGSGGTGANTAAGALTNLGAAASGANHDITSLSGLTTALPISEGGTGSTTAPTAGQLLIGNNSSGFSVANLTQGTGISITNGDGSIGIALSDTGVTLGTYGDAADVATFTVNSQGQLTSADSTPIAINGNQITSGNVGVAYGGTGLSSYSVGDLLYASGATTLSQLSDVATGDCLVSGGVGIAPSWGSCSGSSGITGTGTTGYIALFNGSSTLTSSALSQASGNLTDSGTLTIQGTGGLTLANGSGTVNLLSSTTGTTTFTLPSSEGSSGQCLETDGSSNGVLSFGNCLSGATGGSGGVVSLDGLSGTVGLEDTEGQLTFSNDLQDININLPQELTSSSSPTFDGLTLSTTPLGIGSGGTGANTAAGALTNLGAAASGANHDITSLSGLTTALPISEGGTGSTTAPTAGQLLIGNNSSGFSVANLTQGTGISITNGDGSIGIALSDTGVTLGTYGDAADVATFTVNSQGQLTSADSTPIAINGNQITSGNVGVAYGGTGLSSYSVGDLLYASGATTLSQLSDVATGDCLVSGGVGIAPSWGSCSGSSGITGTGTTGYIPLFNGSSTLTSSALSQASGNLTDSGTLTIQGTGGLTLANGSGTVNLLSSTTGTTTFTLPSSEGSSGQCLETDGSSNGVLSFGNCLSGATGGSGGVVSLDGLSGTVGLEDTEGQLTFSNDLQDININLPQELTSSSSPTFDGLTLSTTPLGIGSGGTGANTAAGALTNLGAAASGANHDITSLSGLTTALPISEGGTGSTTAPTAGQLLIGNNSSGFSVANLTQGTGISITNGDGSIGIALSDTGVTLGTYGDAADVATFTVNSQGQLTSADSTPIAINGNQITSGNVGVAYGGTGLSSYSVGDLLYASGATTLSQLSDVATGDCLVSGGVGIAPSWGSCSGSSGITGTGTTGYIALFNGSSTLTSSALSQASGNLTDSGTLTIQGTGGLTLANGSGTVNLLSSTTGTTTFTLPSSEGSSGQCLETDGSSNGVLSFGNCLSGATGGSGGVVSLDGLSGTVGLEDTEGQLTFSNDLQDININLPQELTSSSSPTFDGLTLSTTPLGIGSGGTGANTAAGALTNLGAAASGANHDITSLSGLTTALPISEGGTGSTTAPTAGQLLIGNNSSGFSVANLTQGTGISITNGDGSIGIALSDTGVTLGTYGDAADVATFTVNSQGQLTSADSTPIAINGNQITSGNVGVAYGGTGLSSYSVGDLLYASGATTLSQLSDVATGDCLVSGGVGIAPSWGSCSGSSGITGTGTTGYIALFNGSSTLTSSALSQASGNLTDSGTLTIQGTGGLTLANGSGTVNLLSSTTGTTTFTLPSSEGSSGQCLETDGSSNGVLSFGNCLSGSGGSGGVTSLNTFSGAVTILGTTNQVNVANSSGTITLSTPQDLATSSSPTFDGLTLSTTPLGIGSGGTGANTAAGALTNLGAAASGANHDITSLSGLTTALPISEGGTGDSTLTINGILYGNGTSPVQATAAANNSVLVTSGTGAPSLSTTLPNAVQLDITNLGTVTAGTWHSTAIGAAYGGTGINTSASTGVATVTAGTWSIASTVSAGQGGTGLNTSASTGVATVTAGTWSIASSLGVSQGGTGGSATPTAGAVAYGTGSAYAFTAVGTNGQCLTSAGSGTPVWSACNAGAIIQAPTTTATNTITPATSGVVGLTVNGTNTGTAATALAVVQGYGATAQTITSSSTGDGEDINLTNTTSIQTNGLSITRNGTGGTTTNLLNLANSAGTATNAINITGSYATDLINSPSFTVTNAGAVTAGTWSATAIGAAYGGTGINTSASTGVATVTAGTWSIASTVSAGQGGTGDSTLTINGILYGNGTSPVQATAAANNSVLVTSGTGAPSLSTTLPNAVQLDITNLGTVTAGTWHSTAIGAAYGGTGLSSYSVGDLLYASGATTLSQLSDVATGDCLVSGGVGIAPSWGSCSGSSGITGTGTTGYIALFNSSSTLANSALSQSSGNVTDSGNLTIQGTGGLTVSNGASISGGLSNNNGGINSAGAISGVTTLTQSYSTGISGSSADSIGVTNSNSGATATTVNGESIGLIGTASAGTNTNNGINFSNVSLTSNNTFNGLYFGTGYDSLLNYDGTPLIDGSGIIQNAAFSSSVAYANITQIGTVTAGTWNANTIGVAYGGTGQTTLSANGILYGNGTGAIQTTASEANSVLVTSGTGAPSLSTTLPNAVQLDITNLGTVTAGTWHSTAIGAAYGGTGINTSASTGVATVTAGTWSIASTVSAGQGGTGLNTSASTGVATVTAGTWSIASSLGVSQGGTGGSATPTAGAVAYGTGSAYAFTAVGTNGQCLTSAGSGTPVWSACNAGAIIQAPTTTATNTITPATSGVVGLTVNGTNTGTAATALAVVQGYGATAQTITSSSTGDGEDINLTNTTSIQTNGLSITRNGTGGTTTNLLNLANSAGTATNAINITGSYATDLINSPSFTVTNAGAVTAGTWSATAIGAAYGGTGINTSASTGVATVTAGTWSIASTVSAGQGGTGDSTLTINGILYGNGTSPVQATAAANNSVLVTSGTGAPSLSTTLPNAVQLDITNLGTVTAGTWHSTAIGAAYGGTGINTSASTGVATVTAGTWSIASTVSAGQGGTGLNTSASTGVATVTAGTWSIASSLGVSQGGTGGSATPTAGAVAYGTGSAYAFTAVGTNGQCLTSAGSGTPVWSACNAGAIIQAPTTTATNTITPATSGVVGLTVNGTNTGTAATALAVVQGYGATAQTITSSSTGDGEDINLTNTTSIQTNGLSITRNGTGGTTTNLLNLANSAGTATNAINITGSYATDLINSPSFTVTNAGAVTAGTWSATAIGAAYGGTGINTSASTGVATVTAGTWSIASTVSAGQGGTGLNTSASTGVATVTAGTWSIASSLGVSQGGTGGSATPTAGAVAYGTGSAYAFTAVGTNGQCLTSAGSGTPVWSACNAGAIIQAPTTTATNTITPATSGVVGLTVNGTNTGTAATALAVVQGYGATAQTITSSSTGDGEDINLTNTTSIQTNGLSITRNGTGGTTTNLLNLANSAGTATNAINITGSYATDLINSPSFTVTNAGAVTAGTWSATAIGAAYGGTGINTSASTGVATVTAGTWSIASTVSAGQGGTGDSTLTINGILYGNGTSPVQATAAANNSVLVTSGTGAPSLSTTLPNAVQLDITNLGTVTAGTWHSTAIGAAYGGTGLTTTPTSGQLLIGNGAGYTLGTLSSSGGLTVANGAGTIALGLSSTYSVATSYIQNQNAGVQTANFNISGAGTIGTTLGVTGLTTLSGGASISGALSSINASSNYETDINTGTSTGVVKVGNTSAGAISLVSGSTISLNPSGGSNTGVVVMPAASSTQAFNVQNTSSASVLDVDTTDGRVGINTTSPAYALDVNGQINSNTAISVNGVDVCTVSSCVTGSSGSFIQNGTSLQSNANFNIYSAATTAVTATIQGASGQSADILDIDSYNGTSSTTIDSFNSNGSFVSKNLANSTADFQIQNSTSGEILQVNSTSQADIYSGTDTGAIGINGASVTAGYALNVTGSINATQIYEGGTGVCLVNGNCAAAGTAGGDLSGSFPDPEIAKLQTYTLTLTSPSNGQLLAYNGSAWVNTNTVGALTTTGTLTANGGASINASAGTNTTNIGTGTTTGAISIGGGSETLAINSSTWDVSTAGAFTGVTGITTSGGYTQSGTTADILTGEVEAEAAGTGLAVTNNATVGGTLGVTGLTTLSGGVTSTGAINLNASAGTNTTNIGTGTTTGAISIGGGSETLAINSSTWDVSTAGAFTGVTGITTSGGYTQSGTTADILTGEVEAEAAGTGLAVTNNATVGGTLGVTGAITGSSTVQGTTINATTNFSANGTLGATLASCGAGSVSEGAAYSEGLLTTAGTCTAVAPASGSANYIQNQTAVAQAASFKISGSGAIGTTLGVTGLTTLSGGVTSTGAINLNASAGTNTTNIGTGTTTGAISIGGGSETLAINSSTWDVSTAGAFTGVTGITTSGGYTQSGTTADILTGEVEAEAAGTGLAVTNNATVGGTLGVTGAITGSSTVQGTTINATTNFSANGTLGATLASCGAGSVSEGAAYSEGLLTTAGTCTAVAPASGSANYIQNQTAVAQAASFKISGSGAIGTTLSVTGATTLSSTLGVAGAITGSSGLQVTGYNTTNTSTSGANDWVELGQCEITTQYGYCNSNISIVADADGNSGHNEYAYLTFQVKQQAALGSAPYIWTNIQSANIITPSNIVAVTTENDTTATVVQLWGQITSANQEWYYTPLLATGTTLTWTPNSGLNTALPSGTQTASVFGTLQGTTLTASSNATVGGTLGVTGAITGSSTVQGTTINATTNFSANGTLGATLASCGAGSVSEGAAYSEGLLTTAGTCTAVAPASGSANYIQNQTAVAQAASFKISGSGAIGTTLGVTGLTTLSGGVTSTGAINLNASAGTNTTNIGTGTTTGAISIGGGSETLAINSSTWDVSTAGAFTGVTGISSSGTITFSGLSTNGLVTTTGGTGTLSVITSLPVAQGGTGLTTTPTSGQLLIGNGAGYTLGTLSSSGGLTVANGAGTIALGLSSTYSVATSYIQNQNAGVQTANFNISGAGTIGTTLRVTGLTTLSGGLAENNGNYTSTATTYNLLQSTVTTLNIGGAVGSGGINLAGGSSSTGCTIDGSTGNLTCSGTITGSSGALVNYWSLSGTTLQPTTSGDGITTSGNISTTGSGTLTVAGASTFDGTVSIDNSTDKILFGSAGDTDLYRSAANTLQTDSYLNIGGWLTVDGDININNTSGGIMYYGTVGVAAPGTGSIGEKIQLYGTSGTVGSNDYALGIQSNNLWFNSNGGYLFYWNSAELASIGTGGLYVTYASANDSVSNPVLTLNNPNGGSQTVLKLELNGGAGGQIRADNGGNIILSGSGTGATYLGWDGGSGGTVFGNGAGGVADEFNSAGNLYVNGGNIWGPSAGNIEIGPQNIGYALFLYVDTNTNDHAFCNGGGAGNTYRQVEACSGSIIADYAEQYPVASNVTYGDIVTTGTNMVNTYGSTDTQDDGGNIDWSDPIGQITQEIDSTSAYQNNIVGVVSDNDNTFSSVGYNIEAADNPMPVALNGRVPVNIAPDSPAIEPGDYITTSGTYAGMGMKATQAGEVVGMALGSWTPGSGETQVMVFDEPQYWPGPDQAGYLQDGQSAVFSSLNVSGDTTLADLTVTGDEDVQGSLSVTGDLTATDATVSGAINAGSLNVSGNATLVGLTVNGDSTFNGDITVNGHIITAGNTPAISAGTAVCSGDTVAISGNDTAGTITLTTGSGGSSCENAGNLAKVNFASAYASSPHVTLTPASSTSAGLSTYVDNATISGSSFNLDSTAPMTANTTYVWYYQTIE